MYRFLKTLLVFSALAAAIIIISGAPAFAASVNQHYTNNYPETAYGLAKILPGNQNFTYVQLNQPFANFASMQFGGCTVAHWSNGTVAPNDRGHACFSVSAQHVGAFATYWTRADGSFIGPAGPIMGVNISYDPSTGSTVFEIDNEWYVWEGNSYPPITGDHLGTYVGDVAITDCSYSLVDTAIWPIALLDSNLITQLFWTDLTSLNTTVPSGGKVSQTYPVGIYPPTCELVLRFNASGDGKESFYVAQQSCSQNQVPSLTTWGTVILCVLLGASAVLIFRHRKKGMAAGI